MDGHNGYNNNNQWPTLSAKLASEMSCEGMSELSRKHYLENLNMHLADLSEPPCDLRFGFADRDLEHNLQIGANSMSRKQCAWKKPAFGRGAYEGVYDAAAPATPAFDGHTRAKMALAQTTTCSKLTMDDYVKGQGIVFDDHMDNYAPAR